jgi:hypothetical protein
MAAAAAVSIALTLVGTTAGPASGALVHRSALRASLSVTPTHAVVGQSVVADIHKSRLPTGRKLKNATISWGDGSTTTLHSLKVKASHRYRKPGQFTVIAKVVDNKHHSARASRTETIVVQGVYWTLFYGGSASYQLEAARLPLSTSSQDLEISGTSTNELVCTSGVTVGPAGRLWVLTAPNGCSAPYVSEIAVFNPPVSQASAPVLTFTLPGQGEVDHLRFDAGGHLWISDYYSNTVSEFTGPFTSSGALSPAMTLTTGISKPSAVAVDRTGNVFVSNNDSTGTHSIGVFHAPVSSSTIPTFLDGLSNPGGLTVDTRGNLYASTNPNGGPWAIVRYNRGQMADGAMPSIVDTAGPVTGQYEADFAWDGAGNLYDADCGGSPSIRVYPLATKSFSPSLAPSVVYTNASLKAVGCAWGIAVR